MAGEGSVRVGDEDEGNALLIAKHGRNRNQQSLALSLRVDDHSHVQISFENFSRIRDVETHGDGPGVRIDQRCDVADFPYERRRSAASQNLGRISDLHEGVIANVFEADLPFVRIGDSAEILTGGGAPPLMGRVSYIAALVDPNTRAVVARIVAPNPGDLLKKQMYVDVSIESGRVSTGLLVPVSAILRDDENLPFVYVALADGSFARRHVSLGYRDSLNGDVTSGLQNGDRIVADGALFLQFMQSQ